MKYFIFVLAFVLELTSFYPRIAAGPLVPIDPICPRSPQAGDPIECFPDGPPDGPVDPPPPTRPTPPGPSRPPGGIPILPDPICREEEFEYLPHCQNPICFRREGASKFECHLPVKKRSLEKRAVPPLTKECEFGIPICAIMVNDCGDTWCV